MLLEPLPNLQLYGSHLISTKLNKINCGGEFLKGRSTPSSGLLPRKSNLWQ
uniref:Uncharacterized protein n=1 Tax=Pseudomonas syringae pv. actinidiae TaxID=103796 RepID=M1JLI4_PSESF|nr:hypothetical protein [Pseudomonas syringae pv. actinidiae]